MRNKLITLVKEAARNESYAFFSGFPYKIPQTAMEHPALWLTPPQLSELNGRQRGSTVYKLSAYIVEPDGGRDEQQKEEVWAKMERDAISIARRVADSPAVFGVRKVQCTPGEYTLTSYGELSMNLSMEVEILFCNN